MFVQEVGLVRTSSGLLLKHSGMHRSHEHQMPRRQSGQHTRDMNDSAFLKDDVGTARMSHELMQVLCFPPEEMNNAHMALQGDRQVAGQRQQEEAHRRQASEETLRGLPRLGPRGLYPEEDVLVSISDLSHLPVN